MPRVTAKVGSSVGLHARPASKIAHAAAGLSSTVTIDGVDSSSALMIMTLRAEQGDVVEVAGDVQADVDRIATLIEQELDAGGLALPLAGGCI
ncbi:HPr family phosphocarrier protein [Nocardioides hungaricus]